MLSGKVCLAKVDAKTKRGGIAEGNWPCAPVRSPSPGFRGLHANTERCIREHESTLESTRMYPRWKLLLPSKRTETQDQGKVSLFVFRVYNYRKPEYIYIYIYLVIFRFRNEEKCRLDLKIQGCSEGRIKFSRGGCSIFPNTFGRKTNLRPMNSNSWAGRRVFPGRFDFFHGRIVERGGSTEASKVN